MIQLSNSLLAWGTQGFTDALKSEVERIDASSLPLQQGLTHGSHACDDDFSVMVLSSSDNDKNISAKVGVFFSSTLAGCNCADDPTPIDRYSEYCEIQIDISKATADATFSLVT